MNPNPAIILLTRLPSAALIAGDLLGCFEDSEFRALPDFHFVSENMTIALCRQLTLERGECDGSLNSHGHSSLYPATCIQPYVLSTGYSLFGLEAGRECYVGNDLVRAVAQGASSGCNYACTGRDCDKCGGHWAISIYYTKGRPVARHHRRLTSISVAESAGG